MQADMQLVCAPRAGDEGLIQDVQPAGRSLGVSLRLPGGRRGLLGDGAGAHLTRLD